MKKGYIVLCSIVIVTALCWVVSSPVIGVSFLSQVSQFLGILSLVGFACANYVSTRHRWLDNLFNGMDKAYVAHKWLSVASIGLVFAHFVTVQIDRAMPTYSTAVSNFSTSGFVKMGLPCFTLFAVFILIALLAKKMNYERWKTIHSFLILPYAIGLFHYYGTTVYGAFSFSPLSLWLNIVNLIGIVSSVYSIFIYEKVAFPFRYKVSSVQSVSKETIEITGKAIRKGMTFRPGQFVFLKFPKKYGNFPSHPFTMSGAPEKDAIQLTIKNLGDHTAKLITSVKADDEFAVTSPQGMFDYTKGSKQQIWIAGGIGVTPFRSFYLGDIPGDFSIDFFYAHHSEEEGVYLEEMRSLGKNNLRFHFIDDTEQGFLTVEKVRKHIDAETPVDIYFCGPKPMRDSFRKNLKNSDIHVLGFHFEEFQFGR